MRSQTARKADAGKSWRYRRHRPEETLLYRLVEEYYPPFADLLAARGRPLPEYVRREFDEYLKCGRLEYGFLRIQCRACHAERLVAFSCKRRGFCPSCGARRMAESAALLVDEVLPELPIRQWVLSFPFPLRFLFASRPEIMTRVLAIVYRVIETHLVHQAGRTRDTAKTGAVTLVQRFGGSLNLNIHFHMLVLDGAYILDKQKLRFRPVRAPDTRTLSRLVHRISQRVGNYLERQGLLIRDMENSYLDLPTPDDAAMDDLIGHSISYRIAVGPNAGRRAFTLQTVPAWDPEEDQTLANASGFSLHAGIAAKAHQRDKLERLCRYIARPAVSTERLSLTPQGNVRYTLKTPYRDGTTHIVLEPMDFIARLIALVPKPRINLTRFHGVFAPNSRWRQQVTPARRAAPADDSSSDTPRHAAMMLKPSA